MSNKGRKKDKEIRYFKFVKYSGVYGTEYAKKYTFTIGKIYKAICYSYYSDNFNLIKLYDDKDNIQNFQKKSVFAKFFIDITKQYERSIKLKIILNEIQ